MKKDFRIRAGEIYRLEATDGQAERLAMEIRRRSKRRVIVDPATSDHGDDHWLILRQAGYTQIFRRPDHLADYPTATPDEWLGGRVPVAAVRAGIGTATYTVALRRRPWATPRFQRGELTLGVGCQSFPLLMARAVADRLDRRWRRKLGHLEVRCEGLTVWVPGVGVPVSSSELRRVLPEVLAMHAARPRQPRNTKKT